MPHVGNARDQAPIRREPLADLFQHPRRLAQVLENIGADDRVKRSGRDLEIELLDIPRPHVVKPPAHRRGGLGVQLDARDSRPCRCLIASPSMPRPAANIKHAAGSLRNKRHDLGPGISEIKRIRTCVPVGWVQPTI